MLKFLRSPYFLFSCFPLRLHNVGLHLVYPYRTKGYRLVIYDVKNYTFHTMYNTGLCHSDALLHSNFMKKFCFIGGFLCDFSDMLAVT